MSKQAKVLQERKARKDRIQAVLVLPGWKEIEKIFEAEFSASIDRALESDDPEARGAVKALRKVMDTISGEIAWGKAAAAEYKRRFTIQSPSEE